jgi:spermidine synthase
VSLALVKDVLYWKGHQISAKTDVEFFKKWLPEPTGSILMLGLGLGNDVLWCLEHSDVQHLDVIELRPEVVSLFLSQHSQAAKDKRLTITVGRFPDCLAESKARLLYDAVIYSIDDYQMF